MDKEQLGIHRKDPRFKKDEQNNSFKTKYDSGTLKIHNWKNFTDKVTEIFNEVKQDNQGKAADYIPQLANVDDELF